MSHEAFALDLSEHSPVHKLRAGRRTRSQTGSSRPRLPPAVPPNNYPCELIRLDKKWSRGGFAVRNSVQFPELGKELITTKSWHVGQVLLYYWGKFRAQPAEDDLWTVQLNKYRPTVFLEGSPRCYGVYANDPNVGRPAEDPDIVANVTLCEDHRDMVPWSRRIGLQCITPITASKTHPAVVWLAYGNSFWGDVDMMQPDLEQTLSVPRKRWTNPLLEQMDACEASCRPSLSFAHKCMCGLGGLARTLSATLESAQTENRTLRKQLRRIMQHHHDTQQLMQDTNAALQKENRALRQKLWARTTRPR